MNNEANSKIAHQLAEPVHFRVGATIININNAEPDIPHIKGVPFSADWKMLDQYEDTDITCISPAPTEGAVAIVDTTVEDIENQLINM